MARSHARSTYERSRGGQEGRKAAQGLGGHSKQLNNNHC